MWPTANKAIYVPFVVHNQMTAVKLFVQNAATVSGNIDLGLYDAFGNRLVSSGSTAQAGTSALQSFDVTDTLLLPGVYYMACALNNGTGTVLGGAFTVNGIGAMGVLEQTSAFALPATATMVAPTGTFIPSIGLTARTLI